MLTLFMTWDIQPGKEDDYQQFVTDEFLPALLRIGFTPQNALFKLAGGGPQVVAIASVESEAARERIFQGQGWRCLQVKLDELITDFRCRRVISERHVQM